MAQPTETIFRQFEICNNIPTEAELNIGDTIRIPTSVAEVLQVI